MTAPRRVRTVPAESEGRASSAYERNAVMDRLPQQTIRRATQQDVGALRALATAAAWGLCGGDYTPQQIAAVLRYGMSLDEQMIADRTYFVVETGRQIVAAGGWSYRAALMGN